MSDVEGVLLSALIGYLLGSINTALLVSKAYGKDVTTLGSRSAGLTNALRVLGKRAAVIVLVGDVLKGVVACLIGMRIGVEVPTASGFESASLFAAGAGTVIGHNWPIYFGFKGGKGALTAAAVMFMVNWKLSAISLILFVVVIALTRFVSLATILAVTFFAAASFMPRYETTDYFRPFTCALAVIIVIKHRENIRRLLSGTENKLSF